MRHDNDAALFEQRTGLPAASIAGALETAAAHGWLTIDAGSIKPTPVGLQMLNSLLTLF